MKNEEISLNTKRHLAEALKVAMRHKPFQKISVSELIKYADVNRKTFYYHFKDIYDLLKWMLDEEAINVVKHFDLIDDYEEALNFVIDYVEENDYIINCVHDSLGYDELKRFFYKDIYDIVVSIIETEENLTNKNLDPSYKEFLTQFYLDALSGMLIDWVKNPGEKDREKAISYLILTIRNSLVGILNDNSILKK